MSSPTEGSAGPDAKASADILWTVVRFPDGSWSYGGRPDCPDYRDSTVWQIRANTPAVAIRRAQGRWRRARDKSAKA